MFVVATTPGEKSIIRWISKGSELRKVCILKPFRPLPEQWTRVLGDMKEMGKTQDQIIWEGYPKTNVL